jgi:hypothetical protein
MRTYDIEFDIDSFLDEMEERKRERDERLQQIHRPNDDAPTSVRDVPPTSRAYAR